MLPLCLQTNSSFVSFAWPVAAVYKLAYSKVRLIEMPVGLCRGSPDDFFFFFFPPFHFPKNIGCSLEGGLQA